MTKKNTPQPPVRVEAPGASYIVKSGRASKEATAFFQRTKNRQPA